MGTPARSSSTAPSSARSRERRGLSGGRAGRQTGFTLLEVLAALVVLGFIIAGLVGGTQLGLASIKTESRIEAKEQGLEPVDRLLRRLVANMAMPNNDQQPGLVGSRTAFTCITKALGPDAPASRIDALVALDHSRRLVLLWSPHLHAERLTPRPSPAEEVLLSGLDRLEISYLSPDRSGWLAAWNRTDLPALIRIRLVFAPGDARRWPPIIAATALQSRPRERPNG